MKKIKILFYSHVINYAGTWRSHERIIEKLDQDLFEPYVLYWEDGDHDDRLNNVEKIIGSHRLIPFRRSWEKAGPEKGWCPVWSDFSELVKKLNLGIMHFARSGYYEWPFIERLAPLQVETNIFGHRDTSPFLDKSIAICHYIAHVRGTTDAVIYNPIPDGITAGDNLRRDFGIPENALVFGRIGRPANFHSIALQAFDYLVRRYGNLFYIIIGPCNRTKAFIEARKIPNIILIEPTSDDGFIERFHRTIDIMLHYRSDGEVHSTALAQAMMYSIPAISHTTSQHNGQIETIGEAGGVARDLNEYISLAEELVRNSEWRRTLSETARKIALERYEQNKIVKTIQDKYFRWYSEIGK